MTVASPADVAFTVFTVGMGTWWEPAPDEEAYADLAVEPRTGGNVWSPSAATSTSWAP